MKFTVTNPDGTEPDLKRIRDEESWAKWDAGPNPVFAILSQGALVLLCTFEGVDDFCICPPDRFTVRFEGEK